MIYTTKKYGVYTLISGDGGHTRLIAQLLDRAVQMVNGFECVAVPAHALQESIETLKANNYFEETQMMPIVFTVYYTNGRSKVVNSNIHTVSYANYLPTMFQNIMLTMDEITSIECEGITYNKQ